MKRIKLKVLFRLLATLVIVAFVICILISGMSPPKLEALEQVINSGHTGSIYGGSAINKAVNPGTSDGDNWIYDGSSSYSYRETVSLMGSLIILIIGAIIILCYLVTDFPSVKIYTYTTENRKIYLGKTTVYKSGNIFYGIISNRVRIRSETGRFSLYFNDEFIDRNRNSYIVIKMDDKNYGEIIKPKIDIKEGAYNGTNF